MNGYMLKIFTIEYVKKMRNIKFGVPYNVAIASLILACHGQNVSA